MRGKTLSRHFTETLARSFRTARQNLSTPHPSISELRTRQVVEPRLIARPEYVPGMRAGPPGCHLGFLIQVGFSVPEEHNNSNGVYRLMRIGRRLDFVIGAALSPHECDFPETHRGTGQQRHPSSATCSCCTSRLLRRAQAKAPVHSGRGLRGKFHPNLEGPFRHHFSWACASH